jgi:TraL protein
MVNPKKLGVTCLMVLAIANGAHAATCRSAEAALRGGEVGLKRDQDAADQTVLADRTSSDILGKCVGGITGIMGTTSFPDLSQIWEMIKDKVCSIASSQVDGAVSAVNSQINGAVSEVNGAINTTINNTGVNSTGAGTIIHNSDVNIDGPSVQSTKSASDSSAFWNDIWK